MARPDCPLRTLLTRQGLDGLGQLRRFGPRNGHRLVAEAAAEALGTSSPYHSSWSRWKRASDSLRGNLKGGKQSTTVAFERPHDHADGCDDVRLATPVVRKSDDWYGD
jgi:hypothetical protein